MAIREILSSLRERLCQQTSPDGMEDLTDNARGLPPPPSYKAVLQAAHQKMMGTATTLQSDLDRLNNASPEEDHVPIVKVVTAAGCTA